MELLSINNKNWAAFSTAVMEKCTSLLDVFLVPGTIHSLLAPVFGALVFVALLETQTVWIVFWGGKCISAYASASFHLYCGGKNREEYEDHGKRIRHSIDLVAVYVNVASTGAICLRKNASTFLNVNIAFALLVIPAILCNHRKLRLPLQTTHAICMLLLIGSNTDHPLLFECMCGFQVFGFACFLLSILYQNWRLHGVFHLVQLLSDTTLIALMIHSE